MRNKSIDEALSPLTELFTALSEARSLHADPAAPGGSLQIESMTFSTPLDLDVVVAEGDDLVLGGAPPTRPVESSFEKPYHRLRVVLRRDDD